MTARHRILNLSAGIASVVVAVLLVALKLWAMVVTGSLSVAASLADNALDVMISVGALVAIAYAARPADEDHAFGHTSAEDLAALLQAALVMVSALMIGLLAVKRLSLPVVPMQAQGWGIAVMGLSVALTGVLVLWQRRVARLTGNRVVAADQLHYLGDLMPTLGVLLALGASKWWGITRLDQGIALVAAAWLAFSALRIGRLAWDALMDHSAPPDILAQIAEIAGGWPGLVGYHDLKTRTAGSRLFIVLHVELDGRQSLNEAHAVADRLEHRLEDAFPGAEITIHLDPVGPGSGRVARAHPVRGATP